MKLINKIKSSIEEFGIYYRRYKGPYNKISFRAAIKFYRQSLKGIWIGYKQTKTESLVAKEFFTKNPEKWEDVKKATYAWHNPKINNAHSFDSEKRDSKCDNCGRTRENVRYDNLPYFCQKAVNSENTKSILKSEEEKAFSLIERAKKEVPKWVDKKGLNGETLAFLHRTHGFTFEIIDSLIDIPTEAKKEYLEIMDFEKDFSRSQFKPKAILIN